jgi:hypothetical protein
VCVADDESWHFLSVDVHAGAVSPSVTVYIDGASTGTYTMSTSPVGSFQSGGCAIVGTVVADPCPSDTVSTRPFSDHSFNGDVAQVPSPCVHCWCVVSVVIAYRALSVLFCVMCHVVFAVRWRGMVWCGVVWCGVVWCGVVWCGVVWCGVVWCGVVWCGVVWCGVAWCAA